MPHAPRPYHHGDLRKALVAEAAKLIEADGIGALTLRELARRLEVSHAAPTNHFADKDALLAELAIEGFDELGRDLAAAAAQSSDALRLRELGRAYIGFAQRRPGHYRVMFGRGFTKDVPPRLAEAGSRAFALLEQAIPAGRAGVPADAFLAWSVVHGAATLLLDGPIPPRVIASKDDREAVARLIDHVTDKVAALLGAG